MKIKCRFSRDFGDFKLNMSFENERGTLALLGASGSGKSMTLKTIAGIIKPDEGYIELNGRVLFDSKKKINLAPQERNIGYLFQDYCLFPNMNVEQNILCGVRKFKLERDDQLRRLENIISLLQLEGLGKRKIDQLSGGQKQRVALARILVGEPELLLLDEPFSALDDYLKTRLEMSTKEIIEKYNLPTILVTHNRDEAYMLSNHTVIIDKGSVVESGLTKELFKNPHYLTSSIITGCKNNFKCRVLNDEIEIPSLGITFKMKEVSPNIKYIGIRAHAFSPNELENSYEVEITDVVEQPFEDLVRFKYKNQVDKECLYWLVGKNQFKYDKITRLGVKSKDVLLLK